MSSVGVWSVPLTRKDRFAFLTKLANAPVASVQPKARPMILAEDEQEQWLAGTVAEVCTLSDAYPDAEMRILP